MYIRLNFLANAIKPDGRDAALVKNMGITFGETVLTKGLNFLLILTLARALGPTDYGKYSFIFVAMALCSALFDFGMENTAVRFASREKERKDAIFGLYLGTKCIILILLVVFFILGGGWLFSMFDKPEMTQYIPYLIIGLLGESMFFVNDTYLQASQRFTMRAILNVARYAACLGYVWALLAMDIARLETVFYVYLIPLAFTVLFMGKYFRFLMAALRTRFEPVLLDSLFSYEKWMAIYSVANNLIGRVDFFLLALWVSYDQMGIYNAAFQLCAVVSFLPFVMGKVLLPALSERSESEIFETVNRVFRTTAMVALAGLILIPAVPFVLPFLLGGEYVAAIPVLQILLIAFLIGLITMPYEQALYAIGRPKILSLGRYAQLALLVVLNVLSIPLFGIIAAAVSMLVSRAMYFAFVRLQYAVLQPREASLCPSR